MPPSRLMLLMGCVVALVACATSSKRDPEARATGPRIICKLVKVDKEAAYFENRSFDAAGAPVGVWTNRVSNKFITDETSKHGEVKEAVTAYLKTLRLQANEGDPAKQYDLGLLCESGRFVGRDDAQAFRWYQRAALQGYAPAQHELGMMYQVGQCVTKDYVESYKWFELASRGGEKWSEENRKLLQEFLSADHVAEARKRADAFKPIRESGK